jgi:hypothetical protein
MASVSKDARKLEQNNKKGMQQAKTVQKQDKSMFTMMKQSLGLSTQQNKQAQQYTRHIHQQNQALKQQQGLLTQIKNKASAVFGGGGRGPNGPNGRGPKGPVQGPQRGPRGGGFLTGAARGMAGAGMNLLGAGIGAIVALPFSQIHGGHSAYQAFGQRMGNIPGTFGRSAAASPHALQNFGVGMGKYGYTPDEALSAYTQFGRATGSSSLDMTKTGMMFARANGLELGEAAGAMGSLRQAGVGESQMKRQLEQIMGAAFKSGLERARFPEYLEGIQGLVSRHAAGTSKAVDATGSMTLLNMLSRTGLAGFQGARGAAVASALDDAFRNPGGGDEGRAVVMQSLGFGTPGGNTSFYDAKKAMQQGLVGGPDRLKGLFDYVDSITGGGEEANLEMEGILGGRLTLTQIEDLRKAIESGDKNSVEQMQAEFAKTDTDLLREIRDILGGGHLKVLQNQAKVAAHDLETGEALYDDITRMQQEMMEVLKSSLPIVKDAVKTLADITEKVVAPMLISIYTEFHNLFGSKSKEEQKKATAEARDLQVEASVLSTKIQQGSATPEELARARELPSIMRQRAATLHENTYERYKVGGTSIDLPNLQGTGEIMDHLMNRTFSAAGADMGTSEMDRRLAEQRRLREQARAIEQQVAQAPQVVQVEATVGAQGAAAMGVVVRSAHGDGPRQAPGSDPAFTH